MRKKKSYYRLRQMWNSRYRWTNHDLRKTQIPQSLHPPPVSHIKQGNNTNGMLFCTRPVLYTTAGPSVCQVHTGVRR